MRIGVGAAGLLAIAAAGSGCSLLAKPPSPAPPADSASDAQSPDDSAPAGPEAKIHISYSHPGDYLQALVVTKYSGAETIAPGAAGASIVRFDGGVEVWRFGDEQGVFSDLPMGGSTKNFAVSEVKYGNLPAHFVETTPDSGPPEPLEPDHFYVFAVTRASGSTSYQAVKVNPDGSLQGYDADPRAGASFSLCCNVSADFTISAPTAPVDLPPMPDSGANQDSGPP